MENRLWLAVFACLSAVVALSTYIVLPSLGGTRGAAAVALATPLAGTSTTLSDVLAAIESQQQALGQEVVTLDTQTIQDSLNADFTRTLERGDSGADVSELQVLLAQFADASATPSGLYGSSTESLVSGFQAQEGLHATGVFDATTRDALTLAVAQSEAQASVPAPSAIDLSSVSDLQNIETISSLEDQVSALESSSASSSVAVSTVLAQVAALSAQIETLQSGLQSAVSTDPTLFQSTAGITVASPVAITSLVAVAVLSKDSATITWTTNNAANSTLIYSTGATLPGSSDKVLTSATLVTNHSETLSPLVANTKYYYEVSSVDGTQSEASSTIFNFTTP